MTAEPCSGGVYRIESARAARILAARAEHSIWPIDGALANTRDSFLAELAEALNFPDYFGHNWDATYDCLTDLAGEGTGPATLLIAHGDQFLSEMGADWKTAERVFIDAAAFWREHLRLLLVILVDDSELPGVPVLPRSCLKEVIAALNVGDEITRVDDQIRILNREGKFDEALRMAQALVETFPKEPRAQFVLAGTFDFQDREFDAVAPYQRAWELGLSGDDVPRFYVQYGSTLRNVGRFEDAVRLLQEGQERFPMSAPIQAFLSLALLSAGRASDAVAVALSALVENAGPVHLDGYERALREYVSVLKQSNHPS